MSLKQEALNALEKRIVELERETTRQARQLDKLVSRFEESTLAANRGAESQLSEMRAAVQDMRGALVALDEREQRRYMGLTGSSEHNRKEWAEQTGYAERHEQRGAVVDAETGQRELDAPDWSPEEPEESPLSRELEGKPTKNQL
jgi:hypothetical protein